MIKDEEWTQVHSSFCCEERQAAPVRRRSLSQKTEDVF